MNPQKASPVLISLPDGMNLSGVTLWAVRLAGVLAAAGRAVTLMVHAEPPGQGRLPVELPAGVRVVSLANLPSLRAAGGDLAPFLAAYRDEARRLWRAAGAPVLFLPNLLGDSYALGAALCVADPEMLRIVGWQHADIEYDTRVLTHYEPVIASFVGVSRRIVECLESALPRRAADISHFPYAVPVGHAPPERAPVRGRPLRLIYTGRLEHKQKRIGALIVLSDELEARGVAHTLSLVGDGPAQDDVRAMIDADRTRRVVLRGRLAPHEVRAALRESDCFVLASRYEGLSVAMLEAMAEGCVPVVTNVASGASEAVIDGLNGLLIDAGGDASVIEIARALADGVDRFMRADVRAMSVEAWRRVRDVYALDRYAVEAGALLDTAGAAPPRRWPADRACAFTSRGGGAGGSGSVPPEGARRAGEVLRGLSGRRVVLYGAGRHTIELAGVLAESPAAIVAVCDDDPGRWGGRLLGWPVIAPSEARAHGATDVVISSWLHADEMFARRDVFERDGLRVHHLYRGREQTGNLSYSPLSCSS